MPPIIASLACESRIESVVVYARGAVVTRRVSLPESLPEGPVVIAVAGLSPWAEAGSLRAFAEGEREVTALSGRVVVPAAPAAPGALVGRLRELSRERERIEAEQASLSELHGALSELSLDPALRRWGSGADPAARFGDALATSAILDAEIARVDALLRAARTALSDNERAGEAARIAAQQGTTAELSGPGAPWMEVEVRLGAGGAAGPLALSYVVRAARWWPAYTARFSAAATRVALAIDAFVAQASGEDWTGVRLSLSTADLAQDARLPELASLRFGRAQSAPRRGYRPAPIGLDAMFEGHDRAVAGSAPLPDDARAGFGSATRDSQATPRGGAITAGSAGKERAHGTEGALRVGGRADLPARSESTRAFDGPADALAAAAPMAAPQPMPMRARMMVPPAAKSAGLLDRLMPGSGGGGFVLEDDEAEGGAAPAEPAQPAAIEPGEGWLDFDALVLLDPSGGEHRGRLVRDPGPVGSRRALPDAGSVDAVEGPPLAGDPLVTRGRFDHRYDAEGSAEVPSNARPHRVAVTAAEAPATPRFVSVPREVAEVFREVEIQNPFAAPLLAGPVDVFLDGALLATSPLSFVDRAGWARLGLGVEERLRVARNARVEEGTAGLLGGSAVVDHAVTIELRSSLGHDVTVDVLERVPVTDDRDVEIKVTHARPEPERYTQAERGSPVRRGLRFSVALPAGDKVKIDLGYRVTLPARNEIVGGNRRE